MDSDLQMELVTGMSIYFISNLSKKRNGFVTVSDGVRTLLTVACDLVSVRTNAQAEFRILSEHFRSSHRLHSYCHSTLAVRRDLLFMTLSTRLIADESSVGWDSPGVPTPHRIRLPAGDDDGHYTQCEHSRDQQVLFDPFTH